MAISHLGRYVNIYKQDGSWLELDCLTEERAAQLAHELLDVFADMVMRLNEEEENEPVPNDRRVSHKVRVDVYGRPQNLGRGTE